GLRQANTTIHRVRLTALEPGKKVYYRACSQPITLFQPNKLTYGSLILSDVHSFVTRDPAAERVKFILYNDLHDNLALWRKLMAVVSKEDCDFVFLNGDVTDYMQNESQMVEHFLDVCTSGFARETPFLYARGNHETRG